MNEYSFLIAIAGILLIGAMSPGPSFFVVAKIALTQSRGHGIATSLGTGLGVAIFAVLASFGVTAMIENVPSAYLVFKIFGGGYLLYLAVKIWQGSSEPLDGINEESNAKLSYLSAFNLGLITQISNPKTALVIAGIFAAFVPEEPPANTSLIVAACAFVIDFSWYAVVAVSLSTGASRSVYNRAKSGFDKTAALFLGAVGLRLLFSEID